jgi:hypothetical protein
LALLYTAVFALGVGETLVDTATRPSFRTSWQRRSWRRPTVAVS